MFFERFGKVVVDDDLVIVQNNVTDKIFHESYEKKKIDKLSNRG